MVVITEVMDNSHAARAGISAGDVLLSINDREICDVLDYRYYLADKRVTLSLLREDKPFTAAIVKSTYDDIGLVFETPLMDQKQSCKNKCIFCFIDQLPKGLRPSLYFKDDDSRLSFLHGNYITLTNLSDRDIDRIVEMRFSPINISVHTTNPDLRVKMMKNPRAGEVLSYIGRIAEAGLRIHGQIVLCRGWNDGEELLRTMQELSRYRDAIDSVSVVPAGLTKFRDGLPKLDPYTPEECRAIIRTVNAYADELERAYGVRIFACADELYVKAGLSLPPASYYEGYPQIENGVGMMTSLKDEVLMLLPELQKDSAFTSLRRHVSLATGMAGYAYFQSLAESIHDAFSTVKITVYGIQNRFFGENVTVAGLLTGKDILEQLADQPLYDALLLSESCVRNEERVFLCGMKLSALSSHLSVPVTPVLNDGADFLSAVFGRTVTY